MLVQVPDAERVVSRILVNAGGRHDPDNATGLAHYLEHMLFKGTQELGTTDYAKEKVHLQAIEALYEQLAKTPKEEERAALLAKIDAESRAASRYVIANEFDQLMEDMGCAEVNAHTYRDFTTYQSAFPTQQLHRWLLLHQHRFERPVFRTFAHELEVVYEEKRRILRNWTDELHGAVFTQHPYGTHTTIGRTEHLLNPLAPADAGVL
jgi:predicted Zn-dependent peptidase